MFSGLKMFTKACAKLNRQGIDVQESRCLHKRHAKSTCQKCALVCPHGAISAAPDLTFIAEKCSGCGACASVCPSGALISKLPSNKELRSLSMLHVKHSGAVVFACEAYLKAHPAERLRVIQVQCIARCHEALLVGAVLQGASFICMVNEGCAQCPQQKASGLAETMAEEAKWLLNSYNYSAEIVLANRIPKEIKPLPVDAKALGKSRRAFFTACKKNSENLVAEVLPEVIFGSSDISQKRNYQAEPKHLPEKWELMVSMLNRLPSTKDNNGLSSSLWGDIKITGNCNGCGACADVCPTAAIDIVKQDNLWKIAFDASRCTKCSLCKDICYFGNVEVFSAALGTVFGENPRALIEKGQEETDSLLESVEQRMTRLLGCAVKN